MPSLDAEETAILASVELGEWQTVPNLAQDIKRYQHYAQVQTDGLESVTIELPASDLHSLEAFAQQSGVSVALLMSSVLHQFVASRQDY
jgi:predicted DNA binding CopG/RHH family protein